jgi:hypothetical protein
MRGIPLAWHYGVDDGAVTISGFGLPTGRANGWLISAGGDGFRCVHRPAGHAAGHGGRAGTRKAGHYFYASF